MPEEKLPVYCTGVVILPEPEALRLIDVLAERLELTVILPAPVVVALTGPPLRLSVASPVAEFVNVKF